MKLITKTGCQKCDWLKKKVNSDEVDIIDVDTPDGLALLAYYQLVETAQFPILITDDDKAINTGVINIKNAIDAKRRGVINGLR